MRLLYVLHVLLLPIFCRAEIPGDDDDSTTTSISFTSTASPDVTVPPSPASSNPDPSSVPSTSAPASREPDGSTVFSSPSSTGSTPEATTTMTFSEITIPNNFIYPTAGARGVLQNVLILRNQVLQLTETLQMLSQDVNPTTSPLFLRIIEMNNTASALKQNVTDLQQRFQNLSATEDDLNNSATIIQSYFTCLLNSGCVTDSTTTGLPTTPHIYASCPTDTPQQVINTPSTYEQTELTDIDCSNFIPGAGNVSLTVNSVEIKGESSYLYISDGATGKFLKKFTNSSNDATTVYGQQILLQFHADPEEKLSFKLTYELVDLCDGLTPACVEHSTCKVGNGKAYCECNACYTLNEDKACVEQQCSQRQITKLKCKETETCKIDSSTSACAPQCVPKSMLRESDRWLTKSMLRGSDRWSKDFYYDNSN